MRKLLNNFYNNHVLANLLFGLVLAMGAISFLSMPREQDPSVNFNWLQVTTLFPGAAAEDVEKLVTDRLEEAIRKLADIRFVSSNSREGVSNILVRFNDLDTDTFDKRVNDLRREIQHKENDLPEDVKSPKILEITSANSFPSAILVVVGQADDEVLRKGAKAVKDDIERIKGVDRVESFGLHDPELQIMVDPTLLVDHGINAIDVSDTIISHFQDVSAGTAKVGSHQWLIRWLGREEAPDYMAKIPIIAAKEELLLGEVARVQRGREKPTRLVNYKGQHAVMLSIMKQDKTNTLELVDVIKKYIIDKNYTKDVTGNEVLLLDDQTTVTRNALNIMQTNAIFGLIMVLFTTWAFLGLRIATLVSIGIPFTLAGTFWLLSKLGHTLNVSVLLGVVITLGMLVDDSVVVVEAIYFRVSRGADKFKAIVDSLQEVFAPVTTSVFTTVAAFMPLMLLPGILGKFMMVIPLVVTIALLISLVEAYWMLPAHIHGTKLKLTDDDSDRKINLSKNKSISNIRLKINQISKKIQIKRTSLTHWLRIKYVYLLIKVLRRPKSAFFTLLIVISLAILALSKGLINVNFFANDPLRIFYVNVEMPPGSSLESTLRQTRLIEDKVLVHLTVDETRSVTAYAGLMFSEVEPFLGDQYGQIAVSLKPQTKKFRDVDQVIADMRADIINSAGPLNISFLRMAGGPPTSKPINIKVRGTDYNEIRGSVVAIKSILAELDTVYDVTDDDNLGRKELMLKPDLDAIHRAGLDPFSIARLVRLLIDGEIVTDFQSGGEKVNVRVRAIPRNFSGLQDILQQSVSFDGNEIRLSELVQATVQPSLSNIRHYNFRRTVTVLAEINKDKINTIEVNNIIKDKWPEYAKNYPNVDLNFSGELDDIQESLDAMPQLFLFGIGLIYLILGTQFRSYWQPLMILATIPLAFAGVIFGLLITRNPLSLYTLYGIVALSGITVNASIVLISAANQRLRDEMTVIHATIYAARRRLIPILITSLTTIAGLFSLAVGLGGKSLLWGPVATSIVWGLLFSTTLTLFFIPLLYRLGMSKKNPN